MRELARMQIELIRMSVRGHVIRNDIHTGHLMFLLPLHAAVLEPDLDLPLGQAECVRDFDSPPPCQIPIKVEFLF